MNWKTPNSKIKAAYALLLIMVLDCLAPLRAFALTGGPSQPEVQSFQPIGTTEMVDLATGTFNYNIPLMDVGGYPINLSYQGGITMDQEASMVGLGWNINPGVIRRTMRGIPDDFQEDEIVKELNVEDNTTTGVIPGFKGELFGIKNSSLSASFGVYYNNYTGVGFDFAVSPSLEIGKINSSGFSAGLGLSAVSQNGVGLLGVTATASLHSRAGMVSTTLGYEWKLKAKLSGNTETLAKVAGAIDYAKLSFVPTISFPRISTSFTFSGTLGSAKAGTHISAWLQGYGTTQQLATNQLKVPAYGQLYSEQGMNNAEGLLDFNREKDRGVFHEEMTNLPLPVRTTDVYNVSGQGISGSYELKRGDVGIMRDPHQRNYSIGASFGAEVGWGALAHAGLDVHMVSTENTTSEWTDDNTIRPFIRNQTSSAKGYERAYFKAAGDLSVRSRNARRYWRTSCLSYWSIYLQWW